MNNSNTVLNKQSREIYNGIAHFLLDTNDKQFFIALRAWQQRRKDTKSPKIQVDRIMKRITRSS